MDKHTPTPWRVEKNTTLVWGACNADDTTSWGTGYPIAECRSAPTSSWAKGPVDTEEAEATAHFIVRAVNSHAALTEAVKVLSEAVIIARDFAAATYENDPDDIVCDGGITFAQANVNEALRVRNEMYFALTRAKELMK